MRARRRGAFALSLLLSALVFLSIPVLADEPASVFRQVFPIVMDQYVDQPDPAFLASSAVAGMEELLRKSKKEPPGARPDYTGIAGDRAKALNLVVQTYSAWLKATGVESRELEYAAISGMVGALDPHSAFLSPETYAELMTETRGSFGGIGIELAKDEKGLTIVTPIEDSPAFRAGLKAGDRIARINGEPTESLDLTAAVRRMRGKPGTKVTLAILRQEFDRPRDFSLTREIIRVKNMKFSVLEEGIGYVRITSFNQNTPQGVENALNQLGARNPGFKGLVLDLRNNPGGLLDCAVEIADKFIDAGLIVSMKGRAQNSEQKFEGKTFGTQSLYPIIVLVNEGTASGAEIAAGALQDRKRAVLLGGRTFGKGTVQAIFPLADKSALRMTTTRFYLPSGRSVEGGIAPDVEVADKAGQDLPVLLARSILGQAKAKGILGVPSAADRLKQLAVETARAEFPARPEAALAAAGSAHAPAAEGIEKVPAFSAARKMDRSNDLAIVIGIEKYQNVPNSDYSGGDARLVKSYLKAFGFPERNIELITDERATYSAIRKAVESWVPNRARKTSRIFVYFSGHGAPEPSSGEAYILPVDGDPNYLQDTGYPLRRLYEALGKLESREVLIVLDSCFSGAGGRSVLAKGARPLVMMREAKRLPPNLAVLTASEGSQISTSSPEKRHGVFTYYFLKALKDGKRNLAQVYDYIRPLVEDEAKALNVKQTPSLRAEPAGLKSRFVLIPE